MLAMWFYSDSAGNGRINLPVPNVAQLVGARLYLQAMVAGPRRTEAPNGLEVTFCP